MLDVLSMGDVMIDFTPDGISEKGNLRFERNPGGAPANVAVTVSLLGGESGFAGAVGNDIFGRFLRTTLERYRVDITGLRFTDRAGTRLAFIELDEQGDRHFAFTKGAVAETFYSADDLDPAWFSNCRIFHMASTIQYAEPARTASQAALTLARQSGALCSYDPNWNIAVSKDEAEERRVIKDTFTKTDVIKISVEELEFLLGHGDWERGAREILEMGPQLVAVSLGRRGCYYRTGAATGRLPAYDVPVRDTTGAGDAFMGGLLFQLAHAGRWPCELPKEALDEIFRFANACGACCAGRRGGMPSIGGIEEVRACMSCAPLP